MADKSQILDIKVVRERFDDFFGLRLVSLTLYPKTDSILSKVLKPGIFKFSDEHISKEKQGRLMEVRLYGKNISVQSIVGMNGSGKSSLLDMIYRLINNFSYYLLKNAYHSEAAMRLAFVHGLYADLKYEVDGRICILRSKDTALALETPTDKYCVGETVVPEWKAYTNVTGARTDVIRDVMKNFFYSIVTNFSFNAFLSSDYASEPTSELQGVSWIDSLFHKNDGYRVPLVINPYRGDGNLDVQRETDFAISRTIAILEHFKDKGWNFIEGYRLDKVLYHYDPHSFLAKFRKELNDKQSEALNKIAKNEGLKREKEVYEKLIIGWFQNAFKNEKSHAFQICSYYGYRINPDDKIQLMAGAYLVYKTISIISKYPVYYDYSKYGKLKYCFSDGAVTFKVGDDEFEEVVDPFEEIVKVLKKDESHITYKLRLVMKYLEHVKSGVLGHDIITNGFELKDYFKYLDQDKPAGNVERMLELFPPTFFKPMILLKKVDKKGKDVSGVKSIPFTSLSSGEKLFIYTVSTLVYHILNIKSVSSKRIHYRRINIIMDELELCFHPEMQRTFVQKLVSTFTRLHINTHIKLNLMLVTHSPFILSDIPKNRILFLEEGKDVGSELDINPFGTNINDVLVSSFFLHKNGFLGDVAQNTINSLVDFLESGNSQIGFWNLERARYFIDHIVGDEVMQHYLRQMVDDKQSG